jgi:acetoin utilization deacetylase AcuC-like enzyme
VKVVYTLRHRLHHPEHELEGGRLQEPFEHPGRAEKIRAALAADEAFEFVPPDDWGTEPIEAVHDPGLVRFLATAWEEYQQTHAYTHDVVPDVFALPAIRAGMEPASEPAAIGMKLGWWCFETTTPLTHGTYDAARSSVDVALTAADLVLGGEPVAYGLCRPPGHHATHAAYGGYCFFNNAAVVAHQMATRTGGKVAVLDVDYHHGNGTQQIFYDRDDVQFVSLHGDPERAYPYLTGFRDERGAGKGTGATSNYPLPARTDDDDYLAALTAACAEVASFGADAVVVSLGLDTYFDDPISDLAVTPDGFEQSGAMIRELGLPTVVLQEGGYATDELGENARRWLHGIMPSSLDRLDPD